MCKLTKEQIETLLFTEVLINKIAETIVKCRKEKKMKAVYEMTLQIKVVHEIDELENLKTDRELATNICEMICDEAVSCGGVASYDILESTVNVK